MRCSDKEPKTTRGRNSNSNTEEGIAHGLLFLCCAGGSRRPEVSGGQKSTAPVLTWTNTWLPTHMQKESQVLMGYCISQVSLWREILASSKGDAFS
jgi:hypothetical protein